jgi:D-alanyl-D-alanine carboxypeptidase
MASMQHPRSLYALSTITLFLAAGVGYLYLENQRLITSGASSNLTAQESYDALVASSTAALEEANTTIAALNERLNLTEEELEEATDDYRRERQRNEDFEDEYREVINTVRDLDKLSKTDEELLQKYSKVYFLNEHYVPSDLSEIAPEWKYNEARSHQLHSKVIPFLEEMLTDAKEDGVDIWVVSAYRSFAEQADLKGAYTVQYGAGANTFSADQGFSEHQLGTAVDFTTTGLGGGLAGFGDTPAYQWLTENAHKYGFVLSYPENNQFYIFEPWHWRFVGEDLARDLERADAHFYDWDQRDINQYLINIFD